MLISVSIANGDVKMHKVRINVIHAHRQNVDIRVGDQTITVAPHVNTEIIVLESDVQFFIVGPTAPIKIPSRYED